MICNFHQLPPLYIKNEGELNPQSPLTGFFTLLHVRVYDQGQASVDEYGSLLCVRAGGCGRWRAALPGTNDRDGHRHAYASAHAQ